MTTKNITYIMIFIVQYISSPLFLSLWKLNKFKQPSCMKSIIIVNVQVISIKVLNRYAFTKSYYEYYPIIN